MGLLDGKRIVVTGVLTDASLAFGVARLAQERAPRSCSPAPAAGCRLTERTARKLPPPAPSARARRHRARAPRCRARRRWPSEWGRSTACCTPSGSRPPSCLGGDFMEAPWDDVAVALQVSAYSLKALADAFVPLMTERRRRSSASTSTTAVGVAGVRLDGRRQGRARVDVALPRPRARSAGHPRQPGRRRADPDDGRQVDPRVRAVRGRVGRPRAARLGRQRLRPPSAKACVALLSDWFPPTTGEIVHVDGGFHAIGA